MTIHDLGYGPAIAEAAQQYQADGLAVGRVVIEHRGAYVVHGTGEVWAEMSGRMRHAVESPIDRPAVGDWVVYEHDPAAERQQIQAVLPRRSAFVRRSAGESGGEQVVATNVDVLFLVSSLNRDLNPARIERYLTLAWESGADPVVVLTKADLCEDVEAAVAEVERVTAGVPVHVTSAVTGEGYDALRALLGDDRTGAAVGSSGVGKSTLINTLCGEYRLATQELREDGKGRHTTTHRELIVLPGGGCIIDTPGMRELQLWDAAEGIERAFEDVEALLGSCRFNDCLHDTEPGCAIREAIAAGTLSAERFESYQKLERELHFLAIREDKRARSAERKKWAAANRAMRTDSY